MTTGERLERATSEQKQRRVCGVFHPGGWEPGLCSDYKLADGSKEIWYNVRCKHGFLRPHEIPPPDLLAPAGFGQLIMALRRAGYQVYFFGSAVGIEIVGAKSKNSAIIWDAPIYDNDESRALVEAAYKVASDQLTEKLESAKEQV
jgi:hypothetical protein